MAGQTTPVGMKANVEWDKLRLALSRVQPEAAELMREEILVVLIMLRTEAERWATKGKRPNAVKAYPRGTMFAAVGAETSDEKTDAVMWSLGLRPDAELEEKYEILHNAGIDADRKTALKLM